MLLSLFLATSSAQTKGWLIFTLQHDTLADCTLIAVNNSVVEIIHYDSIIRIPLDSLTVLFRRGESHFWTGAGFGALAGGVLGAIIGTASYQKPTGPFAIDFGPGMSAAGGAIIGAPVGFAIGGAIGASSGGDELYNIQDRSRLDKAALIGSLIGKHD